MTNSRQPISFVATHDPEAARCFYGDVLGLDLVDANPYALVFSEGGDTLRVQIVPQFTPVAHTVHGWQVKNIELEVAELSAKGVEFSKFDQLEQAGNGVWTSPDGHKIAWFKDPSGNILSFTQIVSS